MRTTAALALAAASMISTVAGHTTVFNILVNDVDQGLGNSASGYIRSPPNNNPITDVTSKDMTCNVNGGKAAAKFIEVAGGDKITFEWHHNDKSAADDIIAESHKGPILTYIAPAKSNGEGNVWLKLAEEGLSNGKWAVDNLIANRGKHSITLPDLAAGEYLLRPEIIALHEGNRNAGAQFYMECVQVKVTSSGSATLPAGVAIPGAYKANDAGVLFDIYSGATSYTIPGPAVWDGASGKAPSAPAPKPEPPVQAPAPTSAPAPAPTSVVAPKPTTLVTAVRPSSSSAAPAAPAAPTPAPGNDAGVKVAQYQRCGGIGHSGATACADGLVCKEWNPYYAQCVPSA
jgi:cellulase